MASLKIGAVPHSDERYIAKLQFFKLRYTDTRIIFFQWKLWYCFFQIWNPGGLQEAFRSCILVWSFDFLSKSVEKTTNIAHLKIGAYTLFDGRYVTKPKIFSKQDRGIIFFPVKAEMFLFPNLKPRRPPGGFPKLYFSLKFWLSFKKCWKNDKYSTSENRCPYSLWWKIRYKI